MYINTERAMGVFSLPTEPNQFPPTNIKFIGKLIPVLLSCRYTKTENHSFQIPSVSYLIRNIN